MENNVRLGLCGKQRSGKDSIAAHLQKVYGGQVFHVAAGVYNWTEILLGYRLISKKINIENKTKLERLALQYVGRWGRVLFGRDIWLKQAVKMMENIKGSVYVTGVRYPNEVKALQALGIKCIWIERSEEARVLAGAYNLTHETEIALDGFTEFDYTLNNSGSLQDLFLEANKAIRNFKTAG